MFDRYDIRYKIGIVWLAAFIGLWTTLRYILPYNTASQQLSNIERSIEENNWAKANEYTSNFVKDFRKNRLVIQMNNATEALTNYEHAVGQLEITVKHEQESALEYIGALKGYADLVIKPFSGP